MDIEHTTRDTGATSTSESTGERASAPGAHDSAGSLSLALWRRCATGTDEAAWRELHGRLAGRIRAYLRQGLAGRYRLACPAEAEDLEQEVFCRLLAHDRRGIRRCRAGTEGELMAYLLRICRSVLASAVREACARKRRPRGPAAGRCLETDPMRAPARDLSPEDRTVVADARRKATTCAVHRCPAAARRQRLILEQVLFVGYTSAELAPVVGLSPSAIDSIVSRARRRAAARGIPFPRRPLDAGGPSACR